MKKKVLNWAKQFDTFCFLDNHQYQLEPHTMECVLAAGIKRKIRYSAGNALAQLQQFNDASNRWLFCHLGYDMKNEIEQVSSSHPDRIQFPDLFFFEPEIVIRLNENELSIEADDAEKIFEEIDRQKSLMVTSSNEV